MMNKQLNTCIIGSTGPGKTSTIESLREAMANEPQRIINIEDVREYPCKCSATDPSTPESGV